MTLEPLLTTATFAAAIGSGLVAGVFFAFSTFVMKALGRLPAAQGMAAMQSINVVVLNPLFLGVFLGTAVACVGIAVGAVWRWDGARGAWLLAGALLYLIGTFAVTVTCNVPLNDALAAVSPTDPEAPARWADYASRWTTWNHVRTAAAVAATGCLTAALRN